MEEELEVFEQMCLFYDYLFWIYLDYFFFICYIGIWLVDLEELKLEYFIIYVDGIELRFCISKMEELYYFNFWIFFFYLDGGDSRLEWIIKWVLEEMFYWGGLKVYLKKYWIYVWLYVKVVINCNLKMIV